jgi:hypothetical protein
VGLVIALPLAGLVLAQARVRRVRALLALAAPPPRRAVRHLAALVAAIALLAAAAAQPALRSRTPTAVRTDAQAIFTIDVSRSMLASLGPASSTRLERAKADAIRLRAAIPDVPSGVATLTDRVLPDLLPVAGRETFTATVERAVRIGQPPPADDSPVATSLGALRAVGTLGYFEPAARHRLLVVLTDGESAPFDAQHVARALRDARVRTVLVHVWRPGEAVYAGTEREQGYHELAASGRLLGTLAAAASGASFPEGSLAAAERAVRAAVGTGPTRPVTRAERTRTLAPYLAGLAIVPLLAALGLGGLRSRRAAGRVSPAVATPRSAEPRSASSRPGRAARTSAARDRPSGRSPRRRLRPRP